MDKRLVRIGEAARLTGVTPETMRKREASGELLPTRKTKSGTRHYSVAAAAVGEARTGKTGDSSDKW